MFNFLKKEKKNVVNNNINKSKFSLKKSINEEEIFKLAMESLEKIIKDYSELGVNDIFSLVRSSIAYETSKIDHLAKVNWDKYISLIENNKNEYNRISSDIWDGVIVKISGEAELARKKEKERQRFIDSGDDLGLANYDLDSALTSHISSPLVVYQSIQAMLSYKKMQDEDFEYKRKSNIKNDDLLDAELEEMLKETDDVLERAEKLRR